MATAAPHVPVLSTRLGKQTLILLCAVAFLDFVDASIVNVALPTVRSDLHFSVQSLQWVVSAYMLTYGGFLLLGGRMAGVTTAAQAGVPPDKAGLAAALVSTSLQLGAALGIAIFSGIATSRTADLIAESVARPEALTAGFQRALLACAVFLAAAALIALRATNTRGEHAADPILEPIPVPQAS